MAAQVRFSEEKKLIETKLGNTIQTKRKQPFTSDICEKNKNLGIFDSDKDTDLEGIKRRKCPVGR